MLMKYRLYTPGPTSVPESTLALLNEPVAHHRTGEFRKLFDEVTSLLQYVYQTSQPVFTLTNSGTGAFEAALTSVMAPGTTALNVVNGKFSERWSTMCTRFGIEKTDLTYEYGDTATPEEVDAALKQKKHDAVIVTYSETSTATAIDLKGVAEVVRRHGDTLLIVDAITGVGALPFYMDDWGIDVCITGSQKSLMLPPGLAFVALSDRAWAAADANTRDAYYYFDLRQYRKSFADSDTPFTPANTLIKAQRNSLQMIRDEGLETVWKRTRCSAEATRRAAQALGLDLFSKKPADSVTAIRYPDGIDDDFRKVLQKTHNIHVAGGQSSMKGELFRINHMGYTDVYDTLAVIAAIEHTLKSMGHDVKLGSGVQAVQETIAEML